jgi:hypothetical protein
MMGAAGEPSGYYPIDSNGLTVQSELPAPCVCPVVVPVAPGVCPPLGYGGCEGGRCEKVNSALVLLLFGVCLPIGGGQEPSCFGAVAGIRVPLISTVLAGCAWACTRVRD